MFEGGLVGIEAIWDVYTVHTCVYLDLEAWGGGSTLEHQLGGGLLEFQVMVHIGGTWIVWDKFIT